MLWTDELRNQDLWVRCAVVWEGDGSWKQKRTHIGGQKEAIDAEMFVMLGSMKLSEKIRGNNEVKRVTDYTDSQVTLRQMQSDERRPGQPLELPMMR